MLWRSKPPAAAASGERCALGRIDRAAGLRCKEAQWRQRSDGVLHLCCLQQRHAGAAAMTDDEGWLGGRAGTEPLLLELLPSNFFYLTTFSWKLACMIPVSWQKLPCSQRSRSRADLAASAASVPPWRAAGKQRSTCLTITMFGVTRPEHWSLAHPQAKGFEPLWIDSGLMGSSALEAPSAPAMKARRDS